MSTEELFERFERTTNTIEKMLKLVVLLVSLTATGVLWGARLEWTAGDHEKRILAVSAIATETAKSLGEISSTQKVQENEIRNLEGKIHGVSTLVGKSREDIKRKIDEVTQ